MLEDRALGAADRLGGLERGLDPVGRRDDEPVVVAQSACDRQAGRGGAESARAPLLGLEGIAGLRKAQAGYYERRFGV